MRTQQTKGVWSADKQPSSLIVNFFEITDIVKNKAKVSCLLNNISKEINKRSKYPLTIKDSTIAISDHGLNWTFDVTVDIDGNYGLLFTGLSKINSVAIN